jgi:hypothetical protein
MFMTAAFTGYRVISELLSRTPLAQRWNMTQKNIFAYTVSLLAIGIEEQRKRIDIIYYMWPKTTEIIWNMLSNRKLVSHFRGLSVSNSNYISDCLLPARHRSYHVEVCR